MMVDRLLKNRTEQAHQYRDMKQRWRGGSSHWS